MPEVDEVLLKTETILQEIETAVELLQSAGSSIDSWQTSGQRVDHSAYKENYKLVCRGLVGKFQTLLDVVNELYNTASEWNALENEGSFDALNDVLSQIYLLGVDADIDLSDIVGRISQIAIEASANEDFSNEDIQDIVSLKDALVSYEEYIRLRNNLDEFSSERLEKTYQISKKVEEKEKDESQQGGHGQSEYVVLEEQWRDRRNEDFNKLYTYIASLPDVSQSTITGREESDVMEETIGLQRDLLGDITNFERAFIYFKYRFPVMAFFSAFIAVFFDLGAFFTGCFLYATEYFVFKKEDALEQVNAKKPNDEMMNEGVEYLQ